ncbi:MAG: helix-turn-helix transcriptional regulator [Bacteroidales bacterium]|nr:helix-turn-helix transcriptional regulator [Bacteroidales bacterium]
MSDNYVFLNKAMNYKTFMDSIMNTGKIITELRKSKDWSQTDLAGKSGVSREMIGKYERGEAVPSIEAAKKIADAFEVSLDYLVGNAEQAIDKATLNRLNDINRLAPADKNMVYAFLDSFITKAKLQSVLR